MTLLREYIYLLRLSSDPVGFIHLFIPVAARYAHIAPPKGTPTHPVAVAVDTAAARDHQRPTERR